MDVTFEPKSAKIPGIFIQQCRLLSLTNNINGISARTDLTTMVLDSIIYKYKVEHPELAINTSVYFNLQA